MRVGERGGALSEDDVMVLSFTGACSPETENNRRRAGCAAECKIIRPGIGLTEPMTLTLVESMENVKAKMTFPRIFMMRV